MNKIFRSLILLLLLLGMAATPVLGAVDLPPKPADNIYVQDLAGIISPEVQGEILQLGSQLDRQTTAQAVVVTVDSLQNVPIEDYANALFRSWGIGDKIKNNGVLILIAPNERQSRIEVGYGLEGALPDGKTGRIQDDYMLPYFQSGDYSSGIRNGYLAIVREVAAEYQVTINGETPPQTADFADAPMVIPTWMVVLIALGVILLIFLDFKFFGGAITYFLISSMRHGGGGGGFGGGSSGGGGSSRRW